MKKTEQLVVGIAVEAASAFGRQVMRGVMKYAALEHRWIIVKEFASSRTNSAVWPRCDGVIFSAGSQETLGKLIKRFKHAVWCSGAGNPEICPVVSMDDLAVGRLAANHLADCRLRNFAFYGKDDLLSRNRLAGFRQALEERALNCNSVAFQHRVDWPIRPGWNDHLPALQKWLRSLTKPIGVFAVDDMAADDIAAACRAAGIHVPDEVAVVGVNNDDLICDASWPPLSSVQTDFERVGTTAAQLLQRMMAGETLKAEERHSKLQPVRVIVRASTNLLAIEDPQVAAAVRFVREHACDPCSVEDILREVPVARRWLERQFSQKLGRTPLQEINWVRIERAKTLLLNQDLKTEQVAERCGFGAIQSFNRSFFALTGETPGAYRRIRRQHPRE